MKILDRFRKSKEVNEEELLLMELAKVLAKDSNCSVETAERFYRLTLPKKEMID